MPDTVRWRLATRRLAAVQRRILLNIVRRNSATAFGRDHGFAAIRTAADYQQRVPVRGYAELAPYIDRCAAGEPGVLTAEPVASFALSSGSTRASKLIPYTPSLMREFRAAINPWLAGMFVQYPALLAGQSYWQVSPVGRAPSQTSGGIPIGFGQDTEYFGRWRAALVRSTLAVAEGVNELQQIDEFRFETLRQLLACRNLRLISVWHPSFLSVLLADLASQAAPLIARIRTDGLRARADELDALFASHRGGGLTGGDDTGRTLPEAIWPELRLISCWTDAAAADAVGALQALFPHAAIQPKGLIATEGITSFPWRGAGSALAVTSHFFEFLDAGSAEPGGLTALAHELEIGRRYSIILTTSGGMFRYRIGDVVELTGRIGQCPIVRFCGKEDGVVDLVGEKLNGVHVARAAEEVFARCHFAPRFWMLAPQRQEASCGYSLFIQSQTAPPEELRPAFEAALEANFHYAYARRLGQLEPLRLFHIDSQSDPEADYLRACVHRGQRLGAIKRPYLDPRDGWSGVFKPESHA